MNRITAAADTLIGRVTMYRLVLFGLLAILAESLVLAGLGRLVYQPLPIVVSAVVAVASTVVGSHVVARLFRARAHTESSVVTGLILLFLFSPSTSASALGWLALAGLIAAASKFVLAVRGRHVFNPAALAAVVLSVVAPSVFPTWWVGSPFLLPVVALAALAILYRIRHLGMGVLFAVVAIAVVTATSVSNGSTPSQALSNAVLSSPVVFFAGFMLSEPLTLPPRRWQRLALAVVVGVLFGVPFNIGPLYGTYEFALIVGNVLAFAVGQRRGIRLAFVEKRRLTDTSWEVRFRPLAPLRFRAGQYLELSLPHAGADSRGRRRVFSIVSGSGGGAGSGGAAGSGVAASTDNSDVIGFGIKTAVPSSSFKTALLSLEPGAVVTGTSVGGDFALPRDGAAPLLLVAGGIGITPFVAQLGELAAARDTRDVVLVYSVPSFEQAAYRDELEALGVRTLLVAPEAPESLPEGWTYVGPGRLTERLLSEHVTDAARRHAFVSGAPGMVREVGRVLKRSGVRRVTMDAFSGY